MNFVPLKAQVFTTWDVGTVLRYLKKFHPAGTLSLKMLTLKLVMLSALVSASRCSYLYQFDLKYHYIKDENYFFVVAGLVKGSTPKKPHTEIRLLRIQPCAVSLIVKSILGGHKHIDQILPVKTYCFCPTSNHIIQ